MYGAGEDEWCFALEYLIFLIEKKMLRAKRHQPLNKKKNSFSCTKQINEPVYLFLKLFTLLFGEITKGEYTKTLIFFFFIFRHSLQISVWGGNMSDTMLNEILLKTRRGKKEGLDFQVGKDGINCYVSTLIYFLLFPFSL